MIQKTLQELERGKFYGTLELKFEAGRIVLVRKTETFKPTEPNYGTTGASHDLSKH